MNAVVSSLEVPSAAVVAALVEVDPGARSVRVGPTSRRVGTGADAIGELAVFLYTALHAGNPAIFAVDAVLPDPAFEADIVAAIDDPGMLMSVQPTGGGAWAGHPDGFRAVDIERVRVAVPARRLEASGDHGDLRLRLPCSRPNLSPGFFMFVHEPATQATSRPLPGEATRFYVRHDDGDDALADWAACLRGLTGRGLSFRTKLLSRRSAYPRNDAIVFYAGTHAEAVREVVTGTQARRPEPSGGRHGSPLCVDVGAGVSRAEDPRDPRPPYRGQSFGEHRCRLIAEAVLETLDGGAPLEEVLVARCEEAHVDAGNLARNRRAAEGQART